MKVASKTDVMRENERKRDNEKEGNEGREPPTNEDEPNE